MDIVGPLPPSDDYKYCLTIIDRYSRWPEAIPIKNTTADTVVEALNMNWIARYGAPAKITTDQGTQFESQLFQAFAKMTGSHKIRTTAYHPASNGIVERWHRSLKAAIMCHGTKKWTHVLPTVLLGLRTAYKEDIKASAAELLYGTTLKIPGEFFVEEGHYAEPQVFVQQLREHIQEVRPVPTAHHLKGKPFIHAELDSCTHVFVRVDVQRKSLEPPYEGPYAVVERTTDKVFKVNIKNQQISISVDRLKPAHVEATDQRAPATSLPSTSTPIRTYAKKKTLQIAQSA